MLEYAHGKYKRARPHKNGGTEGDHLDALATMGIDTGEVQSEPPAELMYLWAIHRQIRFAECQTDDGLRLAPLEALTYQSVVQYSEFNSLELAPWEIDVVMSLDTTYERCANGNG